MPGNRRWIWYYSYRRHPPEQDDGIGLLFRYIQTGITSSDNLLEADGKVNAGGGIPGQYRDYFSHRAVVGLDRRRDRSNRKDTAGSFGSPDISGPTRQKTWCPALLAKPV